MTQVVLEDLDPIVIEKLQVLAQRHNRSLEEEVKAILEQVAEAEITSQAERRAAFQERLNQTHLRHGNQVFSDSVELLREDRNR